MSLVRLGRSFMLVTLPFRLTNFGRIGCVFASSGMPIRSVFFAEFQRDPAKNAKILADRALRLEIK